MKSDKILKILPKLQTLNEEDLQKIDVTIDACLVVQNLKKTTNNLRLNELTHVL